MEQLVAERESVERVQQHTVEHITPVPSCPRTDGGKHSGGPTGTNF